MTTPLSRRAALHWLGAAATASAWLPARLALAAPSRSQDPQGPRLVVVLLRGALDGLAAVPAYGDAAWSALRGNADADAAAAKGVPVPAALRLDAGFGLHPSLAHLHAWYGQNELLVVHATASPYRERSHFDAQQLLESGGDKPFALNTGWLGRALQATGKPAIALAAAMPLALRGADGASTWTPDRRKDTDQDLMARVGHMYRDDAQLATAFGQAMGQQDMSMGADGGAGFAGLAKQAGSFLADPKGPRVAWLEAGGWDTHTNQASRLTRLLTGLDDGLGALREGLGAHWAHTTVLVMTEFGRSAAYNGTGGTDHGTGGVAFLAGGNVAGGKVLADWPGLAKGQLLDGRDLKPTIDLRSVIWPVVQRQFALTTAQLQSVILPGAIKPSINLWRT
jgi:uncharacterized protein (DUF1501 family)